MTSVKVYIEHMSDSELQAYIADRLAQGETKAYIRTTLRANGWPDKIIDEALKRARPTRERKDGGYKASELAGDAMILPPVPPLRETPTHPTVDYDVDEAQPARVIRRRELTILSVVIVLTVLAFVGFMGWRNRTPADSALKQGVRDLSNKLTAYYTAHQTYPKDSQLTQEIQSSTATHYSYQVFSASGSTCDAQQVACERAIVSTALQNGAPYVVVLDKGDVNP